jgi:uncharacterized protein YhdP
MVALTILKVTGILAGGAILGVEPVVSGAMAAIVAILQVSRDLAKAYVIDGKLDDAEINESFKKIAEVPVQEEEPAAAQNNEDVTPDFAHEEVEGH